jgi:hypothetical protein
MCTDGVIVLQFKVCGVGGNYSFMRRGGALAFFFVATHKFLIERLNNQLEEILFGELFLLTLILLSTNNTNHTFLLSTIDSQHGFKPGTF